MGLTIEVLNIILIPTIIIEKKELETWGSLDWDGDRVEVTTELNKGLISEGDVEVTAVIEGGVKVIEKDKGIEEVEIENVEVTEEKEGIEDFIGNLDCLEKKFSIILFDPKLVGLKDGSLQNDWVRDGEVEFINKVVVADFLNFLGLTGVWEIVLFLILFLFTKGT